MQPSKSKMNCDDFGTVSLDKRAKHLNTMVMQATWTCFFGTRGDV